MPPAKTGSGRSLLSERAKLAKRTSPAVNRKRTENLRMEHPLSAEDRRRAFRSCAGSVRRGGSEPDSITLCRAGRREPLRRSVRVLRREGADVSRESRRRVVRTRFPHKSECPHADAAHLTSSALLLLPLARSEAAGRVDRARVRGADAHPAAVHPA